MKLPLVAVHWTDARSVFDQMTFPEAQALGLVTRVTSGFLVREDGDVVTVAHTLDPAGKGEEDAVADVTVIPRGWVQEIVRHSARRPKKEKK